MAILSLIIHPNEILRTVSRPIEARHIPKYVQLGHDMAETMIASRGIGLAAPQIGQNIRLIVIQTKDGPQTMFNPVIQKKSLKQEWGEEGCLSIPGIFGDVKRRQAIRCAFIDEHGQERTIEAEGLMARVIQHEIDHLDGILFIDKGKNIHEST